MTADVLPSALFSAGERARFLEQLKRHEGLRLAAYLDSEGVLTIGYGHNCAALPLGGVTKPGDRISREQAELIFKTDVQQAEAEAVRALPCISALSYPRRAVLINMLFNMGLGSAASGRGLMGFKRMHAALQEGDYGAAAREMLQSRWARQVGPRSRELAAQMTSGSWAKELPKKMAGALHV